MKDLLIELILVAMIVMPLMADSLHPARAVHHNRLDALRKVRRGS